MLCISKLGVLGAVAGLFAVIAASVCTIFGRPVDFWLPICGAVMFVVGVVTARLVEHRPRRASGESKGLLVFVAGMADGRALLATLPPVKTQVAGFGGEDMFHQPGDPLANLQRLCKPGIRAASCGAICVKPFEVRHARLLIQPIDESDKK